MTDIFKIASSSDFDTAALEIFCYQYIHCDVYRQWVDLLGVNPKKVSRASEIPAIPIELFKNKTITSFREKPTGYFQSSGTSGMANSHHYYRTLELYDRSAEEGFTRFWGSPKDYCIVALLPNYLKQGHSSLIHMMQLLINRSQCPEGGFFSEVSPALIELLHNHQSLGRKLLLFGVTYALLDIIEQGSYNLEDAVVFETGGMKGQREEMVKEELHKTLCKGFHVDVIASEYGMCELFSQAYSRGKGIFQTPPWMQIRIRDIHAPNRLLPDGRSGGIDVIDLANVDSCSFIATQDLGKLHSDGSFEILGRFDHSDMRGCNLMTEM
ncbi:MAG: acyltransferase [Bacteroidales bacterium]|nr:acyltransferase [Bacteroidales bacterium]